MRYVYNCPSCGVQHTLSKSIHDEFNDEDLTCRSCGARLERVYEVVPIHYNSQGFHKTDYDKNGDKLEQLNRKWSANMGEPPPPPSTKVPRNSKEKY